MKNLRLSTRLIISFVVVAVITLMVGTVGLVGAIRLQSSLLEIGGVNLPAIDSLYTIKEAQTAIKAAQRTILMTGITNESMNKELNHTVNAFKRAEDKWSVYEALKQTDEDRASWARFKEYWNVWKADHDEYVQLVHAYEADRTEENYKAMQSLAKGDMSGSFYDASNALQEVIDYYEEKAYSEAVAAEKQASLFKALTIVFMSVGTLVAVLLGVLFSRSINHSLQSITHAISRTTHQVASASSQLASAGQQISQGAAEQAASIEETSATMEETSSMVQRNAENTQQANELSRAANSAAEQGSSQMKDMSHSMEELKKSSGDIAKIIKVIEDIAFQTNMLALNAAVEAARAGDAGQGFAVVAEEVRNLAQKSAQAAKDTTEIIDRNIQLSENGAALSAQVNVALDEILEKTQNVNKLMDEIAAASDEQAKGTAQVNEAISHMDRVVQQNAAATEQSAATSEELQNQAKELSRVVNRLDALVQGTGSTTEQSAAPALPQRNAATHHPAPAARKQIVSPNDVIPLDDNDDF